MQIIDKKKQSTILHKMYQSGKMQGKMDGREKSINVLKKKD